MSDSEDSTITYTEVYSLFEDLSDIGSLGVDRLPMMLEDPYVEAALQALPSLDYVSGPEYPPSLVYEPYVPELVYPEFMPPEEDALPAEEQPLPATISSTADSPGYITESDPEEDTEEDDEDPKKDPTDYPDDRDDDDDEEEESSGDDADDEEDEEEEEHLALADSVLPHILSPPLPISPLPLPASPTYPLGYKTAMIRLRAESPSTSHPLPSSTPPLLPINLPTSSPPLLLPSMSHRADVPEREVGYGITDTWDEMVEDVQGTPIATDMAGLSQRMTDFVTTVRQDTDEIYRRLDDAQDDRLMESEARLSREACVQSMDISDTARSETQVTALQSQQGPASSTSQPDVLEEAGSVADALVARKAPRSKNGKDIHDSGMGGRRQDPLAREMFPKESDKIKKYVSGLPDMIHGSLMASKPKTMQDAIEFTTTLMDKKIRTFAERHSKNKRKQDDNQQQQQQNKSVLQNATSATELAIWPVTIGVLEMPTLLTNKGALGQGNETLIIHGDESDRGNETRLNIISCTKTQKHMLKGCHVFLAHVTTKESEDKSEKKRLEDLPIVQDFSKVFPEDLPGLPPTRQVEF
ncbi:hypothetical protein Tco_0008398 [Tanacetum coccineum]